jgi:DUF1680 family protein
LGDKWDAVMEKGMLNGVVVLKGEGKRVDVVNDNVESKELPVVLIPYYSWANRGEGEMNVWFLEKVRGVSLR